MLAVTCVTQFAVLILVNRGVLRSTRPRLDRVGEWPKFAFLVLTCGVAGGVVATVGESVFGFELAFYPSAASAIVGWIVAIMFLISAILCELPPEWALR